MLKNYVPFSLNDNHISKNQIFHSTDMTFKLHFDWKVESRRKIWKVLFLLQNQNLAFEEFIFVPIPVSMGSCLVSTSTWTRVQMY